MFLIYIKQTLRAFRRDRLHTLITMLGLTIGLACAVIVNLFISNELTYEAYHENAERIYRVGQNFVTSGKPKKFSWTSPSLGPKLHQEFPQIESFARLKSMGRVLMKLEDYSFYEDHIAFADTNFFKIFSHSFIHGDPNTCLLQPESIVLTESLWHKYFGDEDPLGQSLMLENQYPVVVTAVIKDLPSNTHFYHTAYASYLGWDQHSPLHSLDWSLFEINDQTFLLFYNDFNREAFDSKWPEFYEKYVAEDGREYGQVYEPIFEPLTDIHYHSDLPTNYIQGNRTFLITILSVGIFLLVLAGLNYTNLATARAFQRLRGISIQKVVGASIISLVLKLILESLLMALISLILAFGLVEFLLEFSGFAGLLGIRMTGMIVRTWPVMAGSISVAVLVGLLSGLYPAIYLTRFSPIKGLHGQISLTSYGGRYVRQALVIFQLVLAVVAITFTVLMRSQIKYLENHDLGFDMEDVIIIPSRDSITNANIPVIRDELLAMPAISAVSSACSYPGFPSGGLYTFVGVSGMEEHNLPVFFVDYGFIDALGINLLQGRDFNSTFESEFENSIIINESLARYMDWDEPLGKMIKQGRSLDARVIGIVEDFNFRSLHHPLDPLMIRLQGGPGCNLIVKAGSAETGKLLDFLEERFKELVPLRPFEYYFLEDSFNRQYSRDEKHMKFIGIFSMLCIFIACLGLFTLVSYSAERRTKEIGIRKVNGASTRKIISLFISNVFMLCIIAILISTPLIIWMFRMWLREFTYQASLSASIFLLTFTGVILITILTVLYHAVKAAGTNPVQSLRNE